MEWLKTRKNVTRIISGGALGFDQALAGAAYQLSVPFSLFLPFEGMDSRWPEESRAKFRRMVEAADEVRVISDRKSRNAAYLRRDEAMVDECTEVVAMWDGRDGGGTHHTVRYAERLGRSVTNLWETW